MTRILAFHWLTMDWMLNNERRYVLATHLFATPVPGQSCVLNRLVPTRKCYSDASCRCLLARGHPPLVLNGVVEDGQQIILGPTHLKRLCTVTG